MKYECIEKKVVLPELEYLVNYNLDIDQSCTEPDKCQSIFDKFQEMKTKMIESDDLLYYTVYYKLDDNNVPTSIIFDSYKPRPRPLIYGIHPRFRLASFAKNFAYADHQKAYMVIKLHYDNLDNDGVHTISFLKGYEVIYTHKYKFV